MNHVTTVSKVATGKHGASKGRRCALADGHPLAETGLPLCAAAGRLAVGLQTTAAREFRHTAARPSPLPVLPDGISIGMEMLHAPPLNLYYQRVPSYCCTPLPSTGWLPDGISIGMEMRRRQCSRRQELCHAAATPLSPISRFFSRDGEGGASQVTVSPTAALAPGTQSGVEMPF